jgi:hypothetical protein
MKNVKSFNEFVNEGRVSSSAGELVADWAEGETLDMYNIAAKALGIYINSLKQLDSEMDEGSKEYDAAVKAFNAGKTEDIKLPGAGVAGPFLTVNKKNGIAHYAEQGLDAYLFSDKSNF